MKIWNATPRVRFGTKRRLIVTTPSRLLKKTNYPYSLQIHRPMTLEGFISIAEQATTGGAPIDAFQADAFRRNDALFEQIMQALMASPFMPTGTDGNVPDPDPRQFV